MNNKKNALKGIVFLCYLLFLVFILAAASVLLLYLALNRSPRAATFQPCEKVTVINEYKIKTDFSKWNKNCDWNLVVVNSKNQVPAEYTLKLKPFNDVTVDRRIIYYLEELLKDTERQNLNLWVSSGHTTFEKQRKIFNNKAKEFLAKGYNYEQSEKMAQETIDKPETSEHHLGLAVDFNGTKDDFCNSPEYDWLEKNCTNYGFILRYEKSKQNITGKAYRPWHFRYVGEKHAKKMQQKNMCLEEYVSYLEYEGKEP